MVLSTPSCGLRLLVLTAFIFPALIEADTSNETSDSEVPLVSSTPYEELDEDVVRGVLEANWDPPFKSIIEDTSVNQLPGLNMWNETTPKTSEGSKTTDVVSTTHSDMPVTSINKERTLDMPYRVNLFASSERNDSIENSGAGPTNAVINSTAITTPQTPKSHTTEEINAIQEEIKPWEDMSISQNHHDESEDTETIVSPVKTTESPECISGQATPLRLPPLPNTFLHSSSPLCSSDSRLLDLHLRNHTLWAVQMQDAGSGGITGVLEGNVYQLGDFDECLSVTGPVETQYCLVEVRIHTPPRTPDYRHHPDFKPDPMQSVWNRVRHEGEDWRLPLDVLHIAVCAPASCSAREIQDAAQVALDKHASCEPLPVSFSVKLPETLCSSKLKQSVAFSRGEIVYMIIVLLFAFAVLFGTFIDHFCEKKKGCIRWFFLMFSAKRSWNMLTRPDPRPCGLNLDSLAGVRTINMILLVLAHRGFNTLRGPVHNYNDFESMPRSILVTGATHAQLFVDTCFALSGLLVALLELTRARAFDMDREQDRRPGVLSALFHRYMRLTPSYAMVVFFYATIFWRTGSGPLWDQVIGHEADACAKYWWTNLFYVNNYIDTDKLCMFQSWYLPCDLHLFILGTALSMFIAHRRRTGLVLWGLLFIISMTIPFVITLFLNKPALLHMHPSLLRAPDQSENFRTMYAPTHIRAAPYLVGMMAGYILFQHGVQSRAPLSKTISSLLCGGGGALALVALLSSVVFYDPDIEYGALPSAVYAALCPVIWGIGISLIIISTVLGAKTPMTTILSWRPLVILSRLTYNVYLTHWAFQMASVAKSRSPYHLDVYGMITLSLGDIVMSFAASVVLFIGIEAPFRQFTKRMSTNAPPIKESRQPAGQINKKGSALEISISSNTARHDS